MIVKEKRNYEGLQNELTVHALLNLITKVLQTSNSEICVMAIKSLNFILLTVDKEIFEHQKVTVYGFLLRALAYRYVLIAICIDIQMNSLSRPLNY